MAKGANNPGGKEGVYMKAVKKDKGMETIHAAGGDDFGAREAWDAASMPPSVKDMVGKKGEFSDYKHDAR